MLQSTITNIGAILLLCVDEYAREETRDKKFSVHTGAAMEQGSKDAKETTDDAHIRLKRQLGWIGGTAVLVGNVVGSGIFVTPSLIFRNSESVGVALLIWCLSGMLSLMGGLCYAELAAVLPACGGDYAYIVAAGRALGRAGDLTAFMCAWSFATLSDPLGGATQGLTFSTYALSLAYTDCTPPYVVSVLVAVTFICEYKIAPL
nr:Y+L amino acid transporter 2-like [Dermacentor andersoni]